eukprot:10919-Heterococcus_DN1.PRE.1
MFFNGGVKNKKAAAAVEEVAVSRQNAVKLLNKHEQQQPAAAVAGCSLRRYLQLEQQAITSVWTLQQQQQQ